jgi:hypothetical protein
VNKIAAINAAGAYSQISDKRAKTEVKPIRYGLKEVMALEPKEYDLHELESISNGVAHLSSSKSHQVGFLAQDTSLIVPEAVVVPKSPEKELYTMNYTSLVPVVVKAIQEMKQGQDAKTVELETKIAALKEENTELRNLAGEMKELKALVSALEGKSNETVTVSLTK